MTSVLAIDVDGTLLSCRERQVRLAAHLVPNLDQHAFWNAKRAGATTAAALAAQGVRDADRVATVWAAGVEERRWLEHDRPMETAVAALGAVRAAGLSPVLVTARRDDARVRRQICAVGLSRLVDDVVVVHPSRAAEEKADVLRRRGAVGMVGDTESDARAAHLAGVPFAAVGAGQRDPSFLRSRGVPVVHGDVARAVRSLLA